MSRMFTAIALAAVAAGASAAPAVAEERICRGTLGPVTLDNIKVPTGATCTLSGTVAQGTVLVERGATLRAAKVRINGNLQAEGHRLVTLTAGSRVGGSVQLVQGSAATLSDSFVKGDIQLFANVGAQSVLRNVVDGNLQCKENRPAPTGGGNVVGGNKEDQCSRL